MEGFCYHLRDLTEVDTVSFQSEWCPVTEWSCCYTASQLTVSLINPDCGKRFTSSLNARFFHSFVVLLFNSSKKLYRYIVQLALFFDLIIEIDTVIVLLFKNHDEVYNCKWYDINFSPIFYGTVRREHF